MLMKSVVRKIVLIIFWLAGCLNVTAQPASKKNSAIDKLYPGSFVITKSDYDQLFQLKVNDVVPSRSGKYISGSTMLLNTKNGDMKFLKLKLNYFKNALLVIQVNGSATTQVFILSDDKSIFYKGRFEKNNLLMNKCLEDEIVSE